MAWYVGRSPKDTDENYAAAVASANLVLKACVKGACYLAMVITIGVAISMFF